MVTGNDTTAPGVVLADDACPNCGTMMEERFGELTYPVNGQKIPVAETSHLQCPACGEIVLRGDEVRRLRELAFGRYREEHSLLSAEEIRSLRERLGLTQGAFAQLLRLGSNTISRWEAGRKVQTAALDGLLRLIRDLPDSLDHLRKYAA
jgi:putative zinc finger/helix-turn-helix YgiT family protein